MPGQLQIIAGPDKGRSLVLADGEALLLGSSKGAPQRLNDPAVARAHCEISLEGASATITDLGSPSGTLVNGVRIVGTEPLRNGDVLRLGDTQIRVQLESVRAGAPKPAAPAPAPAAPAAPAEEEEEIAPGPTCPVGGHKPDLGELLGQKLGRYQIERPIAKGRNGVVFEATDTRDARKVALKVLWPEFATKPEEVKRFIRAMKTVLPVKNPHIVQVYSAGKNGDYLWTAMQYVEGENCTKVIERIGTQGMLDWKYAFRVGVHVSRALQAADEHQILHRNITPSNILIRSTDKVALLGDLMLAKAMEGALATNLTGRGQVLGEPAFVSPERINGRDVDVRSDIYGLGVTLYALLTGVVPFDGKNLGEMIRKINSLEPAKIKDYQRDVPEPFEKIVFKMIAKNPDDRHISPAAVLNELERCAKLNGITLEKLDEWIPPR